MLLSICAALASTTSGGTGCEQRMTAVCPRWQTESVADCVACVKANLAKLKTNCTLAQAETKCAGSTPSPQPSPEPPLPPWTPIAPKAGALRPHIVLWVVDDLGWANVGYHNPEHVHTPTTDALAEEGIVLDRHYTFRWCAPTRSALMTGRLPYHVLQSTDHVDRGFSMVAAKLRQVGYRSHQVGKWHLGSRSPWMTPVGRGFETSLGYLGGGEDHYTQASSEYCKKDVVDLWSENATHAEPARHLNGTYAAYTYAQRGVDVVNAHNASEPLFMYMALQDMHAPNEVPTKYSDMYPSADYTSDYAIENGMASIADEVLHNVTSALKAAKMWTNTLLVYTSDNGGECSNAGFSQAPILLPSALALALALSLSLTLALPALPATQAPREFSQVGTLRTTGHCAVARRTSSRGGSA